MIRALIGVVTVAFLGWSGYWWVGSTTKQTLIEGWIEDRRAEGWLAEFDSLRVQGYPNRFDTVLQNPSFADPRSNLAWSGDFFELLTLSYKPNHLIAVWPPHQELRGPDGVVTVDSDRMMGSIVVKPTPDLPLERLVVELSKVAVASDRGWSSGFDHAQLAIREAPEVASRYDISFDAGELRPTQRLRGVLDPAGVLPDTMQTVILAGAAGFSEPLDLGVIEGDRPPITHLAIDTFTAIWGDLELRAAGAVDVDAAGVPTGKVTVQARNWRQMIELARNAGAIDDTGARTLDGLLGTFARLSGNAEALDLPISFRGGIMSLGPIPIGPAPRIGWR